MIKEITVKVDTRDFLQFMAEQQQAELPMDAYDIVFIRAHNNYYRELLITVTYYDQGKEMANDDSS